MVTELTAFAPYNLTERTSWGWHSTVVEFALRTQQLGIESDSCKKEAKNFFREPADLIFSGVSALGKKAAETTNCFLFSD